MKKISISFTHPKKFAIIAGMFILMPFTYAVNQNLQYETGSNKTINVILNPGKEDLTLNAAEFIPTEKARRGIVQNIDTKNNTFIVKVGDNLLQVENNASTTFYFGDGESTDLSKIDDNMKIYVFGYLKSDNSAMLASKIVIANKSRLSRK